MHIAQSVDLLLYAWLKFVNLRKLAEMRLSCNCTMVSAKTTDSLCPRPRLGRYELLLPRFCCINNILHSYSVASHFSQWIAILCHQWSLPGHLAVCMSRKHMACMHYALSIVGTVDMCGCDGQLKDSICIACEACPLIWSPLKPVFCAYKSLKCLDLEIYRFMC